jgi:hypothetical protein
MTPVDPAASRRFSTAQSHLEDLALLVTDGQLADEQI